MAGLSAIQSITGTNAPNLFEHEGGLFVRVAEIGRAVLDHPASASDLLFDGDRAMNAAHGLLSPLFPGGVVPIHRTDERVFVDLRQIGQAVLSQLSLSDLFKGSVGVVGDDRG